MPLVLLIAVALTAGSLVGFVAWRYPRAATTTGLPALDTAREVGKAVGRHPNLRAFLGARVDPAAATGLALTLAMITAICGGVLVGALAYLVRANSQLAWIDNGVAKWGNSHATATSTDVLDAVTQLGSIYTVIVLCVVLAVAETIRERSYWVAPFIVAVIAGEEFLTHHGQGARRPRAPDVQPCRCDAGAVVPERSLGNRCCLLRRCGAADRTMARSPGAGGARRPCSGDRRRGRRNTRAARCALAVGRGGRPCARLGLVCDLRDRLRRADPPLRCCRRDRSPSGGGNGGCRGAIGHRSDAARASQHGRRARRGSRHGSQPFGARGLTPEAARAERPC